MYALSCDYSRSAAVDPASRVDPPPQHTTSRPPPSTMYPIPTDPTCLETPISGADACILCWLRDVLSTGVPPSALQS